MKSYRVYVCGSAFRNWTYYQERQRIITSLTSVQSTARKSLQRSGNLGWDKDVVRSVAEHLETQAHVAGKVTYSWQLNDI